LEVEMNELKACCGRCKWVCKLYMSWVCVCPDGGLKGRETNPWDCCEDFEGRKEKHLS